MPRENLDWKIRRCYCEKWKLQNPDYKYLHNFIPAHFPLYWSWIARSRLPCARYRVPCEESRICTFFPCVIPSYVILKFFFALPVRNQDKVCWAINYGGSHLWYFRFWFSNRSVLHWHGFHLLLRFFENIHLPVIWNYSRDSNRICY